MKNFPKGIAVLSCLVLVCVLTACIGTTPSNPTYTVTFKDYDGAILSTVSVESGKAASAPTPPTREGYEFVGWDKSFDAVTSHLTVTAMYQESSTAPRFEASSVTAKAGDTVKVTIQLKNNPGVASIILSVAFDNTALTLTKVDYNHTVGGNTVPPQTMDSPIKLYWINGLANAEDDFVLATLTFTVQDDAKVGAHPITLSYQADDVYDISETNITFEIVSGKVTVK